jgi:hypothetical protein
VHTASAVATVAVHTASAAVSVAVDVAVVVARCILQFVALPTTLIEVVVLVGVGVVAVAVVDFDPVVVDCTTVGAASYRFHPRRSSFITSVGCDTPLLFARS